jgi:hypothetical protein
MSLCDAQSLVMFRGAQYCCNLHTVIAKPASAIVAEVHASLQQRIPCTRPSIHITLQYDSCNNVQVCICPALPLLQHMHWPHRQPSQQAGETASCGKIKMRSSSSSSRQTAAAAAAAAGPGAKRRTGGAQLLLPNPQSVLPVLVPCQCVW